MISTIVSTIFWERVLGDDERAIGKLTLWSMVLTFEQEIGQILRLASRVRSDKSLARFQFGNGDGVQGFNNFIVFKMKIIQNVNVY
jgi:hypothetical protein